MAEVTQAQIEEKLATYVDPYLERDLVSTKCVKDIAVDGDTATVTVVLGFPAGGYHAELAAKLKELVESIDGITTANVDVSTKVSAHAAQKGVKHIEGIKNILAVASGKGGVGKSTTAVNLALALSAEGATVGILDADIYGPSQPRMLGVRGQPQTVGNRIVPQQAHGLQVMSIGFMVEEDTPMIWRGPMVTSALQQLLTETNWESLDYLVIDLPPGTGDIQLTLAQKVPVSGCLIVTTPQDIALLDARKAIQMFRKVEMSVLGIVENMSTHICSQCGHEEPIFGSGGGARMAEQYGMPLLGQLPLDLRIREDLDHGRPTVVSAPESELTARYRAVARNLSARLSMTPRSLALSLPQINIRNT